MEYFAIYAPSNDNIEPKDFVFVKREEALKALNALKPNKDSRFNKFKNLEDALKFAKSGAQANICRQDSSSILDTISLLKSPPPNQPVIQRSLEKSNFPAPKSQDLVKFRKEIEQNNVQKVYELINLNPRYLVSSGDTPAILKEGPRYNALHIAAMYKHAKMAKLILQTVEQPQLIELLHGIKNDPNIEVMSQNLLESYLNTPDKSRNETPLHFASKIGAKDVIEVLLAYPICKMKPNSEGLYPKDIICARCSDSSPELKRSIEELLAERFFVPVLRSNDDTVQPIIGQPFTPANIPNFNTDPLSPNLEIKAYAGPMSSDQAQTFRRRWKTPPRLIPSTSNNHNITFSPRSSSISSPMYSPRMSKSMNEMISSTPKLKKKLFDENFDVSEYEEFEDVYLSNMSETSDKNGNNNFNVLNQHEEEEFKDLLFEDLLEDKLLRELEEKNINKFQAYRNPNDYISDQTPLKGKNDSNSNHLSQNFNAFTSGDSLFCNPPSSNIGSAQITFLDESGSIYSPDNIHDSISFKEKNIRLTDTAKGLEKIGRGLAHEYNVGWKEYWEFLGHFLDIRSTEGLECFEDYLKKKEKKKELNESDGLKQSPVQQKMNDSFGLNSICAGLYSMDINDELTEKKEKATKNGITSPTIPRSPIMEMLTHMRQSSNDLPLLNPYTCIEQSCRTFAKRLAALLEGEAIQDQNSYEKTLLAEINKLYTSIDSYKRDSRFNSINFQKVHSRYGYLLVSCLKKNNVDVKYLRNLVPLMSKIYALASQFTLPDTKDLIKCHAMCISTFTRNFIEHQEKIFNPENVNTETACVDAWNGPDIIECKCLFDINFTSSKLQRQNHRRDIRKRLYSGPKTVDIWASRATEDLDDDDNDESYLSCDSDMSSDNDDEYFTPPQSPVKFDDSDDEDVNMFEQSLEHLEDEKEYTLYINGDQPSKLDIDVFMAIGEDFIIDDVKYPFIHKWYNAMMRNKESMNVHKHRNNIFRLFTPKLKIKG
ncbi:hypothetical protein ACKWTF_006483 [Chironomus riparius]